MQRRQRAGTGTKAIGIAAAALALVPGCGGGGAGGGSSAVAASGGSLAIVEQTPPDEAVQVPLDAEVRLAVDGTVVEASLLDRGTYLETAAGAPVPGSLRLEDGGRTIVFAPAALLAADTDHVFHLSPLTCDGLGRILDRSLTLRFRTIDDEPPAVTAATVAEGASNVSRTAEIVLTLSEAIDPASAVPPAIRLEDEQGAALAIDVAAAAAQLRIRPRVDLRGAAAYMLR